MLNEELPQPFVPGEDTLSPEVGNVVYNLPDDFSVGLVQILPAPWNSTRSVAIVSGTTQEGVGWAINALADEDLAFEIDGDLTFVREETVESLNSHEVYRGALVAAIEGISAADPASGPVVAEPLPTPTPDIRSFPDQYRPLLSERSPIINYLVIGLIGTGIVVIGIMAVVNKRKS